MLCIYPTILNVYLFKNIPSNAKINVGNMHRDIDEYNSGKVEIYCHLYLSSVHQEPKMLSFNKNSNINIISIPCKLIFH